MLEGGAGIQGQHPWKAGGRVSVLKGSGGSAPQEVLLSYSRVHTCTGAEARLSVGGSSPPNPLRVVAWTVYLLPGSRDLRQHISKVARVKTPQSQGRVRQEWRILGSKGVVVVITPPVG